MARGRSREEECRARVNKAAGRDLTEADHEALMTEVQARMQRRQAAGESPTAAARGAGADVAAAKRLAGLVEQRRRMLMFSRVIPGLAERTLAGNEWHSVMAAMGGSVRRGKFFGFSADAVSHRLRDQAVGDLIRELRREDLLKLVRRRDPELDRQVALAMWHLEDPASAKPPGISAEAQRVAEIFSKHQETMRLMLNEAGAWIGKLDHYAVRQSHDMWKIRGDGSDAAFRAWRDFIIDRLHARTFDHIARTGEVAEGGVSKAVNDFLRQTWENISSGVHDNAYGADWLGGFKGPGNIAKRLSQERILHFKDGAAFYEYNQRFGRGTITDAVLHGIERGSHNAAVMRVFGPNPEATVKTWVEKLAKTARDENRFEMAEQLSKGIAKNGSITRVLDKLTGVADHPEHMSRAQWGATFRNFQNLIRLGGVVLSSFPDIPVTVASLRHNGVPILQGYAHMLASLLPRVSEERRLFEIELGGQIQGIMGDVASRLRAEDQGYGHLNQATNLYFKLNGLNWWTDRMRVGEASGIAARMAHLAERYSFEELSSFAAGRRVRATLDRFGLGTAEAWNALRQVETRVEGGGRYLMPSDILDLPDEAVAGLGFGRNAARAKEELRTRYGTLLTDQVREGISEATIRNRLTQTFNTAPGSWEGEAARSLMQFKSFTGNFLARSVGRELFRGETRIGGLNVDLGGIGHLLVGTTVFGALSIMVKDLIAGRDIRDITDAAAGLKFAAASVVQGGGLGVYGDFLLGGANSPQRSFAETLTGPTVGTLSDVARMLGIIESQQGNLGARAVQFGKSHIPFINLFYTKAALDYLLFYGLQEAVNPGYLHRMEQRSRRDYHQTYWLRPTEAVRY